MKIEFGFARVVTVPFYMRPTPVLDLALLATLALLGVVAVMLVLGTVLS